MVTDATRAGNIKKALKRIFPQLNGTNLVAVKYGPGPNEIGVVSQDQWNSGNGAGRSDMVDVYTILHGAFRRTMEQLTPYGARI